MVTGIKQGLAVGDFVYTGAFPAIIISDVRTSTPCCEVFGYEQECGSAYASDMRKLSKDEFLRMAQELGHKPPFRVYGKASFETLKAAGVEVTKA